MSATAPSATGHDQAGAAKLTRAADAAAPMEDKDLLFVAESRAMNCRAQGGGSSCDG